MDLGFAVGTRLLVADTDLVICSGHPCRARRQLLAQDLSPSSRRSRRCLLWHHVSTSVYDGDRARALPSTISSYMKFLTNAQIVCCPQKLSDGACDLNESCPSGFHTQCTISHDLTRTVSHICRWLLAVSARTGLAAINTARAFYLKSSWRWILFCSAGSMLALDMVWTSEVVESRSWPGKFLRRVLLAGGALAGAVSGPDGLASTNYAWGTFAASPLLLGTVLVLTRTRSVAVVVRWWWRLVLPARTCVVMSYNKYEQRGRR